MREDAEVTASAERDGATLPVVGISAGPEAPEEPTPFQQAWQDRWERIRRAADPHRFTYPGQRTPWVDPIPAPDDNTRHKGLPGQSPRTMVRTVLLAYEHSGREAGLRWLGRFEPRIASLGRPDWNSRLAKLRATLRG